VDRERGRWIALFMTESLSLREANALLLREGFYGGMRLDEVRRIERIPVLGTGKTDCKQLRAWHMRERRVMPGGNTDAGSFGGKST
jgi:long-chain-fatty-acid--[acyl-carrier-protein] ligase